MIHARGETGVARASMRHAFGWKLRSAHLLRDGPRSGRTGCFFARKRLWCGRFVRATIRIRDTRRCGTRFALFGGRRERLRTKPLCASTSSAATAPPAPAAFPAATRCWLWFRWRFEKPYVARREIARLRRIALFAALVELHRSEKLCLRLVIGLLFGNMRSNFGGGWQRLVLRGRNCVRVRRRNFPRQLRMFRREWRAQPRQCLFGFFPPIGAPESLRGDRVPLCGLVLTRGFFFDCAEFPRNHRVAGALIQFREFRRRIAPVLCLANSRLDLTPICHVRCIVSADLY